MITKYKNLGTELSQKAMKEIIGGIARPPKTLWRCTADGIWYDKVCYSVQPYVPCSYYEPCTEIGTCSGGDFCIH